MNKIQIVINSVLAAAVVALFVIVFAVKPGCRRAAEPAQVEEGNLPVAYINIDSIMLNYTFAVEAQERLMSKQEDARLKLNSKARTLQNEMVDFQNKLDNGAFLSRDRAEREQQRLLKKQQELQELEQKLTNDIMVEGQQLNQQLVDSVNNFLLEYNADGRFHLILANVGKDNILMATEGYDITEDVVNALNERCK